MILSYLRNHLKDIWCMTHICAFETKFFINKVGIMTLTARGSEQQVLGMSQQASPPLFPSVFVLLSQSLMLDGIFPGKKERKKSTSCQDRIHSFEPHYCRTQFWFTLLEANSTNQKLSFNHSVHCNVPSKSSQYHVHMQHLQRSKTPKFICSFFI